MAATTEPAIPLRTLEEICGALRKKAEKPRMVVGYKDIIKQVQDAAGDMIAAGYDPEEVAAEFEAFNIVNFDSAAFIEAFRKGAPRSARGRRGGPGTNDSGSGFEGMDPTSRAAMRKV